MNTTADIILLLLAFAVWYLSWASDQQKAAWQALWRTPPAEAAREMAGSGTAADYEAAAAAMNTRQR